MLLVYANTLEMKYLLNSLLLFFFLPTFGQGNIELCLSNNPVPSKCDFSYWRQTNYATRNAKSRLIKQFVSEYSKNDTLTISVSHVLKNFYSNQTIGITKNITYTSPDKKYTLNTNWKRKHGKYFQTAKREIFIDSLTKTTLDYKISQGKEVPFQKTIHQDSSDGVSFLRRVFIFENNTWQPKIIIEQEANKDNLIKVSHTYRIDTATKHWNLSDYSFIKYDEQCRIIYDSSFHYDGNNLRAVQLRKKIPSDTAFISESVSDRFDTIPHPEWAKNNRSRAVIHKWEEDTTYTVNAYYTFNDSLELFIPVNKRIFKTDTVSKTSIDTLFIWSKNEGKWFPQFKSNSYTDSLGVKHSLSCNFDIEKKEWDQGNIQESKMFCEWHLLFQKTYAWRGKKKKWVCYSFLDNVYK